MPAPPPAPPRLQRRAWVAWLALAWAGGAQAAAPNALPAVLPQAEALTDWRQLGQRQANRLRQQLRQLERQFARGRIAQWQLWLLPPEVTWEAVVPQPQAQPGWLAVAEPVSPRTPDAPTAQTWQQADGPATFVLALWPASLALDGPRRAVLARGVWS